MAVTKDQVTFEIDISTESAEKSLNSLKRQLDALGDVYKQIPDNPFSGTTKGAKSAASQIKSMEKSLKQAKVANQLFGKSGEEALEIQRKAQIDLIKARELDARALTKNAQEIVKLKQLTIQQINETNKFYEAKKKAASQPVIKPEQVGVLKLFNDSMARSAIAVTGLASGLQIAKSAFLALGFAAQSVLAPFKSFETAMIGVAKTANLTNDELKSLSDGFLNMSTQIPVAANELGKIAAIAGQLGVRGSDNINIFTETVAKLTRATNLTAEAAATNMTRILNVTGESISTIDEFGSVLVRLGNNVAATESEIVSMTNEVARNIAIFGASAAESAALGAAMREMGIQSEIAGSTMQQVFNQINQAIKKGGEDLQFLSDLTGKTAEQIAEDFGENAVGFFQDFINGLSAIDPSNVTIALEQFGLTGLRVNKVVGPLTQNAEGLAKALDLVADELENTTALETEAARAFTTLDSELQKMANAVFAAFSVLGESIKPALVPVIRVVTEAFKRLGVFFQTWVPPIINLIVKLGSVFGDVFGLIASVTKILLQSALWPLVTVFQRVYEVSLLVIEGWSRIIGLVKFLGQTIKKNITDVMTGVIDKFKSFLNIIPDGFLTDSLQGIKDGLTGVNLELGELAGKQDGLFSENKADEFLRFLDEGNLKVKDINQSTQDMKKILSEMPDLDLKVDQEGEKVKSIIDDLLQANADARAEIELFGLNQIETIEKILELEDKKLDGLEQQLKDAGLLVKYQKELAEARSLNAQLAELKISKLRKDALEDIVSANKDLTNQLRLQGKEGQALAEEQLKIDLEKINSLEDQLEKAGLLTEEAKKQLDIQRELVGKKAQTSKGEDDSGILSDIQGAVAASFAAGAEIYASVIDLAGEDMALSLQKSTDQMVMGLANVANNASAMIMNALEAFDAVINALPGIIASFMDMLPEIIDKAVASLLNLFEKLPVIVENIMAKLPEIITQLLDNLPTIIEKFIQMIPKIFTSIIQRVPEIIVSILDRLPEIVGVLIEELIAASGDIVAALVDTFITKGGIFKIAEALVKSIIKLVPAIVKALADGLSRAVKSIFSGVKIKLPSTKPLEESVEKIYGKVISGASKVSEEIFSVVDIPTSGRDLGDGAADELKNIQEATDNVVKSVSGIWNSFLDMLKKAWMWVWEKILEPVINAIRRVWLWVYNTVLKPILNLVQQAFKGVMNLFKNLKKTVSKAFSVVFNFFKNIAAYIRAAFSFVVNFFKSYGKIVSAAFAGVIGFFKNYAVIVKEAFNTVINFFKNIFKGNIEEAFAEVFDFFRKLPQMLENLGKPLIEAYDKTFGVLVEFFEKQLMPLMKAAIKPWTDLFKGIQDVFKQAIKPFTDFFDVDNLGKKFGDILKKAFKISPIGMLFKVDAIRGIFQKALNFNPISLLSKLFGLGDGLGKKGGVEKLIGLDIPFVAFSEGGPVPGKAAVRGDSRANDTVPAMLSPGEYVLPKSVMALPGVWKVINALMRGQVPQMFGLGGIVSAVVRGDSKKAEQELKGTFKPPKSVKDVMDQIQDLGFDIGLIEKQVVKSLRTMISRAANFNTGGFVDGPSSGADDLFARLTKGEYVMSRPAVNAIGRDNLNQMNRNGSVGAPQVTINFEPGSISIGGQSDPDQFVEEVVEGIRRRSLDGDFIMAVQGLRFEQ